MTLWQRLKCWYSRERITRQFKRQRRDVSSERALETERRYWRELVTTVDPVGQSSGKVDATRKE